MYLLLEWPFLLKNIIMGIYVIILIEIAVIDWEKLRIYDQSLWRIMMLAGLDMIFYPETGVIDHLKGALVIAFPMFLLAFVISGAFGGGDIKLMAVSGLLLGTRAIVCAMVLAIFAGGGYVGLMFVLGKLKKRDRFAFGPFLSFGLAVSAVWGEEIVGWYLSNVS